HVRAVEQLAGEHRSDDRAKLVLRVAQQRAQALANRIVRLFGYEEREHPPRDVRRARGLLEDDVDHIIAIEVAPLAEEILLPRVVVERAEDEIIAVVRPAGE